MQAQESRIKKKSREESEGEWGERGTEGKGQGITASKRTAFEKRK